MSRKAKKPIDVTDVKVDIQDDVISVEGKFGSLSQKLSPEVSLELDKTLLYVKSDKNAMSGLYHSLISNMVTGVKLRFKETLTLNGVGYKASLSGTTLNLNLGYSHPTTFDVDKVVEVKVVSPTEIDFFSPNKQILGQVCAEIISLRPAKKDPYKHKGIKRKSTVLIKKAGKKVG